MPKKKASSADTPKGESERPAEHGHPNDTRPHQTAGGATNLTAHAETQASPPTEAGGGSFPDIFGLLKVLQYGLSWAYQRIPPRYRCTLVGGVIVLVVLGALGYSAYHYWWWLVGVPHVHVSFHNRSGEPRDWPRFGRIEVGGGTVGPYRLRILPCRGQPATDGSAKIGPWKEMRARLVFPRKKDLYQSFKEGDKELVLEFHYDQNYQKRAWALKPIVFDKEGLANMKTDFILRDDEDSPWERLGICVCFETKRDVDPNSQMRLESLRKQLEDAAEASSLFGVVPSIEYVKERQRIAKHAQETGSSTAGESQASHYRSRSIVARVTIGCKRMGRGLKWVFDVNEAQNRIGQEEGRVLEDYSPTLTSEAQNRILTALQQKIVECCGIDGRIEEVLSRGDAYEAILDVGSYMGVRAGMSFDVFWRGTDNLPRGQVEIESVPEKSIRGARGVLTPNGERLNENNYTTFEGLGVRYPPERERR